MSEPESPFIGNPKHKSMVAMVAARWITSIAAAAACNLCVRRKGAGANGVVHGVSAFFGFEIGDTAQH